MRRVTTAIVAGVVLSSLLGWARASAQPLPAVPYQHPGLNQLVSVSTSETQATGHSYFTSISDDGRRVAFFSDASDLVSGDTNGQGDVFVRDVTSGETELVSAAFDGGPANGMSMQPAISGNGRFVVFLSDATNLFEADDTWGLHAHVYVRDLETGELEQIDLTPLGAPAALGALRPTITDDGSVVAFHSATPDLVDADTNGFADVFVADRQADTLERVSIGLEGVEGDQGSFGPTLSGDGRFVTFYSAATNLIEGDENGFRDYFIRNLETDRTELISVASDDTQGNNDSSLSPATMSADGRYVAFQSLASNLVPHDTNGAERALDGGDVFVRDRVEQTTERVSVTSAGEEMGESNGSAISADGRYVAFDSIRPGEDPGSFVAADDIFLRDRLTGTTELLSATPSGGTSNGNSENVVLTPDARFVAWQGDASDIVSGDDNESSDIFLRDRGSSTGIVDISSRIEGRRVDVEGLASLQGVVLTDVRDGAADSDLPGAGADLLGASITYRPESADLLFRSQVAKIDRLPGGLAGSPLLTYGFAFDAQGVLHEIRARRFALNTEAPGEPEFNLYRCDVSPCERITSLSGGFGTTGEEISVALPVTTLVDLVGSPDISGANAFTASDDPLEATPYPGDIVHLPQRVVPTPAVELAAAPTGAAPSPESYEPVGTLDAGRFGGTITLPARSDEGDDVWVRACVAEECGVRTVSVPGRLGTTLDLDFPSSVQFSDRFDVSALLRDVNGAAIPGATVEIIAPVKSSDVVTDEDGVAALSGVVKEAAAPFSLTVTFFGDEDFRKATLVETVDVLREDVALSVSKRAKDLSLRARLVDSDSRDDGFGARRIVFFKGNRKLGSAVTDEDGSATLSLRKRQWRKGRYKAVFRGDDYLNADVAKTR